ncbi:MAG: DUF1819 family protein [Chloroflexota bacterium]
MEEETYSLSFTTGALLYHESITVAELYAELEDWDAVRQVVISENRLQMRTLNASKRIYREITSRLKTLTRGQLALLLDLPRQDQCYLLWLAVCKRYRFIYDFAVEVIREKFLLLDMILTHPDYDRFFNAKAEWHPEMDKITGRTRYKQRQMVFLMLREADLVTDDFAILPTILSPRLMEAISQESPADMAVFPTHAIQFER